MKAVHPGKKKVAPHNKLTHTFDSKIHTIGSFTPHSLKYASKFNSNAFKFNPNNLINKKVYRYSISYRTKRGKFEFGYKKRPHLLTTGLKLFRKTKNASSTSSVNNDNNQFNDNEFQLPQIYNGLPSLHFPLRTGASPDSKWTLKEFVPRSRSDSLRLRHWRRVNDDDDGNEAFANLNIVSYVPEFTEDEYKLALSDPSWTYENTQLLCKFIKRFSHDFIIVGSEFRKLGISIDNADAKHRYYDIILKLSEYGKPIPENENQYAKEYFEKNYYKQEKDCNTILTKWYQRTRQEVEEETMLALQASHIIHNYTPPPAAKPQIENFVYGSLDVLSNTSTNTGVKRPAPTNDPIKSVKSTPQSDKNTNDIQIPLELPPQKQYHLKKDSPPVGFFLRSSRIPKIKTSAVELVQRHTSSIGLLWYPSMPTAGMCPIVEELQDNMVEYLELKQARDKLEAELRNLKNNSASSDQDSSIELSNSTYNGSRNADRNTSSGDSLHPKKKKRKD